MKKLFLYTLVFIFTGSVFGTLKDDNKTQEKNRTPVNFLNLPEALQTKILEFSYTRSTYGVNKRWDKIILGTQKRQGIGWFSITHDPTVTNEQLRKFGNLHTLILENLVSVTDVSNLSGVHTLNLRNLPNVKDISALSTVKTLTMENLPSVTDLSALRKVDTIFLVMLSH